MEERITRNDKTIKILLLGDQGVGKSTFVAAAGKAFSDSDNPNKITTSVVNNQETQIRYEITEVPKVKNGDIGDAKGRLPPGPYDAVIIICDLTNKDSIDNLSDWVMSFNQMVEKNVIDIAEPMTLYIVGNQNPNGTMQYDADYYKLAHANLILGKIEAFYHFELNAQNSDTVQSVFKVISATAENRRQIFESTQRKWQILKKADDFAKDPENMVRGSALPGNTEVLRKNKPPKHIKKLRVRLDKLKAKLRELNCDFKSIDSQKLSNSAIALLINQAYEDCFKIIENANKDNLLTRMKLSIWKRDEGLNERYKKLSELFNQVGKPLEKTDKMETQVDSTYKKTE